MSEVESFEPAVETAQEFAKEDGKTLVLVAGDYIASQLNDDFPTLVKLSKTIMGFH